LPAATRRNQGEGLAFVAACLALLAAGTAFAEEAPSSTLRWRPHSQTARKVSVDKKSNITRTQLLGPAEGNPLRQEESGVEELPSLELAPGVRPVLQPDPDARQAPPISPDSPRRPSRMPTLEEQFSMAPAIEPADCPSPSDLKRVTLIDVSLLAPEGDYPQYCPLADTTFEPRHWPQITYTWKATALCHKPLYFEERALERYGHTVGHFQPLVSGAMFFGTLPILPYKMGMHSPWECMYTLGYYQPNSCAPWIIPPVPLNLRGALLEAGAWTGGVYLIP
jgi:hypothetical protein